jgi:site-specific recombinase XerC
MSDTEAMELQKRLSSLASARKAGRVSEADYRRQLQELQNLATHHGEDAQAQIAQ